MHEPTAKWARLARETQTDRPVPRVLEGDCLEKGSDWCGAQCAVNYVGGNLAKPAPMMPTSSEVSPYTDDATITVFAD